MTLRKFFTDLPHVVVGVLWMIAGVLVGLTLRIKWTLLTVQLAQHCLSKAAAKVEIVAAGSPYLDVIREDNELFRLAVERLAQRKKEREEQRKGN